jgi:hypothetical protein
MPEALTSNGITHTSPRFEKHLFPHQHKNRFASEITFRLDATYSETYPLCADTSATESRLRLLLNRLPFQWSPDQACAWASLKQFLRVAELTPKSRRQKL